MQKLEISARWWSVQFLQSFKFICFYAQNSRPMKKYFFQYLIDSSSFLWPPDVVNCTRCANLPLSVLSFIIPLSACTMLQLIQTAWLCPAGCSYSVFHAWKCSFPSYAFKLGNFPKILALRICPECVSIFWLSCILFNIIRLMKIGCIPFGVSMHRLC